MSIPWVIAIAVSSSAVSGFFVACTFFGLGYRRRCAEQLTETFEKISQRDEGGPS